MAKVFNVQDELHESPNRNNFDLTHKVHMTGKFGYIYPFMCQPVVPTDAWSIDTAIGINLMPMWYPTQSNMRFIVHYFYVPNRIIHKDWKNTLEGLEEHEFPYLELPHTYYRTGTLADYLGVPTNFVTPEDFYMKCRTNAPRESNIFYLSGDNTTSDITIGSTFGSCFTRTDEWDGKLPDEHDAGVALLPLNKMLPLTIIDGTALIKFSDNFRFNVPCKAHLFLIGSDVPLKTEAFTDEIPDSIYNGKIIYSSQIGTLAQGTYITSINVTTKVTEINAAIGSKKFVYAVIGIFKSTASSDCIFTNYNVNGVELPVGKGSNIEVADFPQFCPYAVNESDGSSNNRVRVRAFAFRAYEMIYNAFYRDSHGVQPFVVDGETKYNQYIPTDDSGADTYEYKLHQKNWELDAYTSCLPSPQQGDAPVIGVTVDGTLRVSHDDGRVSDVHLRETDGRAGIEYHTMDIDEEHPEDARTIVNLASSGLTIADFRAGNALQRFLETSLRSGFRYADFIFGHFGKSPSHQELDMPVFLGGYTQMVDVSKISNVSAAGDAKLGEFAGSGASFPFENNHGIKHYFDDFGYVVGVMMLVPDSAYSQVLPKHFTYNSRLDFYFPQFSQLGLQPITYEEMCPIQRYAEYAGGDSEKLLADTFGYQRPNHDLVWLPDQLHGLFRTDLNGSVINRRFGHSPELSDDFLKIDPKECNDIFSVTEPEDDVWIGQVVCQIKAQRPIPRVVIPSLGR